MADVKCQRCKEEMIACKMKTKNILKNSERSDINLNSKANRCDALIFQNEEEDKLACSNEMLHDILPEIESIIFF